MQVASTEVTFHICIHPRRKTMQRLCTNGKSSQHLTPMGWPWGQGLRLGGLLRPKVKIRNLSGANVINSCGASPYGYGFVEVRVSWSGHLSYKLKSKKKKSQNLQTS